MLKIDEVIVVEGKYDKIKLSQFIDGTVIETSGFRIFNDPRLRALLAEAAGRRGLIVMTDSDNAGFQIRRYLRSFIDEAHITNVYVPAIAGKEKRKKTASASGTLGVEGLSEELITKALADAGVICSDTEGKSTGRFTTLDLYRLGLSGKRNSRRKLEKLLDILGLPQQFSTKETLDALGILMTKEAFAALVEEHSAELASMD